MATRQVVPMKKSASKSALGIKVKKGLTIEVVKSSSTTGFGSGKEFWVKKNEMKVIQFPQGLKDLAEWDVHQVIDGKRFLSIPCLNKRCALCDDPDPEVSRRRYRAAINVYSFQDKKIQVLEFGPLLAKLIFQRYERKPSTFTKRTFEIKKLEGDPWYDIIPGEDPPRKDLDTMQLHDLEEYVEEKAMSFYGDATEEVIEDNAVLDPDEEDENADQEDAPLADDGEDEEDSPAEEEEDEKALLDSLDAFEDEDGAEEDPQPKRTLKLPSQKARIGR